MDRLRTFDDKSFEKDGGVLGNRAGQRPGPLGIFAISVLLIWVIWAAADTGGWVFHDVDTSISVAPTWMVGEVKVCTSAPLPGDLAKQSKLPKGYAVPFVSCGDGYDYFKTFKVRIYGRITQPEHLGIHWSCTRNSDSMVGGTPFTCRETDTF
jgi:hypothetical protein